MLLVCIDFVRRGLYGGQGTTSRYICTYTYVYSIYRVFWDSSIIIRERKERIRTWQTSSRQIISLYKHIEIFKCFHHQFQYYINFAVCVGSNLFLKQDIVSTVDQSDIDYTVLSVCLNVAFTEIMLFLFKNVGDLYVHKCDEGGVKRKQHFAGRTVCHAMRERRVVDIRNTNARKCILLHRTLRVTTRFLSTLRTKSRTLSRCCKFHFYISISGSTNYDTVHSYERSGVEKMT